MPSVGPQAGEGRLGVRASQLDLRRSWVSRGLGSGFPSLPAHSFSPSEPGAARGRGSAASPSPICLVNRAGVGALCSRLRFPAPGVRVRWVLFWFGSYRAEHFANGWGLGVGIAGKPPAWPAGSFSAPSACSGNEAAVGREEAWCLPWRRLRPQHRLLSSGLGPFPLMGIPCSC